MLKGIDISNWQSVQTAAMAGADFVIVKATQGTGYVSPVCDKQYQLAKKSGKKVGVYHYASGGNPVSEADFFVNNCKGYIGDGLLALDWESGQNSKFSQHATWVLAFLARVYQRTGVRPVVYMSAATVKAANWSSVVKNNYGLWVAGWPDSRNSFDIPAFPYNIAPWSFYALWQYSSSGGKLDRDVFSGSKSAWDKYANKKVVVVPPTTTTTTHAPKVTTTTTVATATTTSTTLTGDKEEPTMPEGTTTTTTEVVEPTTTTTTHTPPIDEATGEPNYRALSEEEFAALTAAGAFESVEGWKPVIPDAWRLFVYLSAGIGVPAVTLVCQLLALFHYIDAALAIQIITVVGTFFGTVAGLFGVSHFTRSK